TATETKNRAGRQGRAKLRPASDRRPGRLLGGLTFRQPGDPFHSLLSRMGKGSMEGTHGFASHPCGWFAFVEEPSRPLAGPSRTDQGTKWPRRDQRRWQNGTMPSTLENYGTLWRACQKRSEDFSGTCSARATSARRSCSSDTTSLSQAAAAPLNS